MEGKLLVATPAFDPMLWVETYAAMVELDTCGLEVECYCPAGYTITEARTKIAQHALETGADWLLCVDSDNVLPKDALANMLEHGVDVCFGYYTKGTGKNGVTCLHEAGGTNYDRPMGKDKLHGLRDAGETLVEVRGGGFGCVLVRPDVFRRIRKPWFEYVWSREGRKLSEDYGFCTKCRNAGMKLYADTRVDCGHVKEVVM